MAKKKTMIEGFWERFEDCMQETKESKGQIGKRIGCKRQVLHDDLAGRSPLSIYVLRFCAEYGFSLDYLLGIKDEMTAAALGMAVIDSFGERFEECMNETTDSKTVIAKKIGCDRKTLMGLSKQGRCLPSLLYIARFCSIYGFNADYLVGISDKKKAEHITEETKECKITNFIRPETRSMSDWKPIPGFEGLYEASYAGNVRRIYKNGNKGLMTAYEKKARRGSRYLVVKLTKDGKSKEMKLSKLIYEAYNGEVSDGCSIAHLDEDYTNNELKNLIVLTKKELGKRTAHKSKSKAVVKYSAVLIPIETYRSAREAAKNNGMSYQTVIDRCNGKVKSKIAPDGYIYKWEDSEKIA